MLLTYAFFASALALSQGQSAQPAASQPTGPDESLWGVIVDLEKLPPPAASQPFEQHLLDIRARRQQLLEAVKLYRTLHPGGRRLDDVLRIQLQALFELGSLDGGNFQGLCRQVDEYLERPPSEPVLHEAAYWAILCRRMQASDPARPAFTSLAENDPRTLSEYREYIRKYPASRHVPRLAVILAEEAHRRNDVAEIHVLATAVRANFPNHAATRWLEGLLRRINAVNQSFDAEFTLANGTRLGLSDWRGHPVLIVIWAGSDQTSRAVVAEIAAFATDSPDLRIIGLSLDESLEAMEAAARELNINWPQQHEPHGLGGEFAQHWGVRRVPFVFAIERSGKLVGAEEGRHWRALANRALDGR